MIAAQASALIRFGFGHLARVAPQFFFFALFPAFFAYHSLIATGLIRPFLPGGGWSVLNATGTFVLGCLLVRELQKPGQNWLVHACVATLIGWVAAYAAYFFLFGDAVQRNPAFLMEAGKLLLGWGCLYCIGFLLQPTNRTVRLLFYCMLVMSAVAFLFLDSDELIGPQPGGATYQWFATAVLFVAVTCLALLPKQQQPYLVAVVLPTLFVLGSRSEFVAFLALIALWAALRAWRAQWRVAVLGVLIAAGALSIPLSAPDYFPLVRNPAFSGIGSTTEVPAPTDSRGARQLEILDLNSSDSWRRRSMLLRQGLATIRASPVLGDYGSYVRGPSGASGNYMHNALSAWQQFGLAPFLIYLGLSLLVPIAAAWQMLLGRTESPLWEWTLYTGAVSLLLIAVTKSVFWPLPALAWGLAAARLNHRSVYE